jgi:L-ascorbate metabolism protein UlaG (beta-lactamase superfamily)
MQKTDISIRPFGQVGYRYQFGGHVVYTDPYLSNSVQEKEGSRIRRTLAVPVPPQSIIDANCVVITHIHQYHCDESTLLAVSQASHNAIFIGPAQVCIKLSNSGIAESRLVVARDAPVRDCDKQGISR